MDVPIEGRDSEINGELQVLLVKGRFQLCAEDAIYSFEDLYDNYFLTFDKIKEDRLTRVENVLVLGLGLGSIPLMLEKNFGQSYHYTAVEIDEEIIDLAHTYTLPRLKESSINILCGDAEIFVATCQETFDMITVDLFINDFVPGPFETKEFLIRLRTLLNKNGIILFNQLGVTEKDRKHAQSFFDDLFIDVFPDATILKIKGNYMLLNDRMILK